jgi:YD repeat-containing protein
VLMGNLCHMLLETPQGNLVAGMQGLQSTYTLRYNARHRLRGHLFQKRSKALKRGLAKLGLREHSLLTKASLNRAHPPAGDTTRGDG